MATDTLRRSQRDALAAPRTTVRRKGANLEKWGWIYMRVSGVLLVVLSQLPQFRELARRPAVGGKMNVNRFAHDRSVSLLAGKTGFTAAAGYCLAMAEEFDGQVFALVVLNARDREARAQDMNALRRFTQKTLQAGSGAASRR